VAARFSLILNRLGAVRTKTLKAFPEAAYREIVASLAWHLQRRPAGRGDEVKINHARLAEFVRMGSA
jgi:hypothetical protein